MLRRILLLLLAPVLLYWGGGLLAYRFLMPPVTPLMVLRSVERGHRVWHETVPIEQIAPALALSVVAAEDSGFCAHPGIDVAAVRQAWQDYRRSGRLRGASTISMQVARNLFLWTGGGVPRKLLEVPLALALDALWPKRRILEVYLNVAEWGPGVFGAGAAARYHFGVPAARLSASQAAALAAVLPSPRRWNPRQPTRWLAQRVRHLGRESTRLSTAQTACFVAPGP